MYRWVSFPGRQISTHWVDIVCQIVTHWLVAGLTHPPKVSTDDLGIRLLQITSLQVIKHNTNWLHSHFFLVSNENTKSEYKIETLSSEEHNRNMCTNYMRSSDKAILLEAKEKVSWHFRALVSSVCFMLYAHSKVVSLYLYHSHSITFTTLIAVTMMTKRETKQSETASF